MPTYMGRKIAPLLTCNEESEAHLSRPERWLEEKPQHLLDALFLRPDMIIADIGAGTRFMTVQLALRVGRRGLVFDSEIQPRLPSKMFDLILLVDNYHEAPRPDRLLYGIRRALKSNGRLAIVEYRKEDHRIPIDIRHRMNARQIIMELQANHFRLV